MTHPLVILIAVMTVLLGVVSIWLAVVDARADRAHQAWMRRNTQRRRRTEIAVKGIRYGYRGNGLDGRADHPDALRKHTAP